MLCFRTKLRYLKPDAILIIFLNTNKGAFAFSIELKTKICLKFSKCSWWIKEVKKIEYLVTPHRFFLREIAIKKGWPRTIRFNNPSLNTMIVKFLWTYTCHVDGCFETSQVKLNFVISLFDEWFVEKWQNNSRCQDQNQI